MNIQLSRRERLLVTVLCVALILVIGARLLVLPAYNGWVTRTAHIRALESARAPTVQDGAQSGSESDAEGDAAFFLPKASPEEFHRYFAGFVSASGLKLVNIAISESSGDLPGGFSNVNARLSLSGTQGQVIRFIGEVERSGRAIAIESMSLRPLEDETVMFDVSLKVYCISNSKDDSLDFTPETPESRDGFRFSGEKGGEAP